MRFLLLNIILFTTICLKGQLITSTPAFPGSASEITITFDASKGNKGLENYTGDVYAHTGVITNLSSSDSDWKYVKTDWGENTTETKLTRISENIYQLNIAPNAKAYYGVPENEEIVKLAFVFRSDEKVGSAWKEAKTEAGGDIFLELSTTGLNAKIISPETPQLLSPGDYFKLTAIASQHDSILLFVNNEQAAFSLTDTLIWEQAFTDQGKYKIHLVAKTNTSSVVDSTYFFVMDNVPIIDLPEGVSEGINYTSSTEATLVLYAPNKNHVFLIGDFNNWEMSNEGLMNRTTDGNYYWTTVSNLVAGKEYIFQYWVDNKIKIGDPYAEKIADPWNDKHINEQAYPDLKAYPIDKTSGIATYLQTNEEEYEWSNDSFTPPAKEQLVIYELLIRDFTEDHSYQSLINNIDYFVDLGINAIELMPINEFEGNESWGYNPSYYFAPDKYYGTKNKLKEFIDICHQNGIAVIIDMVLNHAFGQSPQAMLYFDNNAGQPTAENPWLNPVAKHPFNVGYDFNHESEATKYLVERVVKFWLDEYKIDGYRFDLSKGFSQRDCGDDLGCWNSYDASRVAIWERISTQIWETNPNAYVIMEHLGENDEEKVLANKGMMLWGKASEEYYQSAMGYHDDSDFSWKVSYKLRGWNNPNLVSYMESHDEERVMHQCINYGSSSNNNYSIKGDTVLGLERMALAHAFLMPVPGPKMIWQFGELGYDISINYNGRTGNKPIKWEYTEDINRLKLLNTMSAMNKAKTTYNAFNTNDFNFNVGGDLKTIHLNHSDFNTVIIGNFGVTDGNIVPHFQTTGRWYEFYSGDSLDVTNTTTPLQLKAGEYRMYTTQNISLAENKEAKILGFSLAEQNTEALINQENKTVSIEIKPGNDISKLVPDFSLSTGARILSPSTDTIDFTNPVKVKVISEDLNTINEYTITITEQVSRNVRFEVDMSVQMYKGNIFSDEGTIAIVGSFDNWKTHKMDDIDGDSIYTAVLPIGLGDSFNFRFKTDQTEEFDGTEKYREFTVKNTGNAILGLFNNELNNENSILSFKLNEQLNEAEISEDDKSIKITVVYGTDLSLLKPIIASSYKSTVSPKSGVVSNFTEPVNYLVTAQNGDQQIWEATVVVSDNRSNKANILSFAINGQVGETIVDTNTNRVNLIMPFGTDITALDAEMEISAGATIDTTFNSLDYTNPLSFTITAQDEVTAKEWTVIVGLEPNSEASFLSYKVENQSIEPLIFAENRYIQVHLQNNENIEQLIAEFTMSEGATAYIGDVLQETGITKTNFSATFYYTLIAQDGITTHKWMVEPIYEIETSIHELQETRIYPNPFSNELNITGIKANTKVQIYNVNGQLLFEQQTDQQNIINTTKLTKGIYILKLVNNSENKHHTIIKL